jgi:hypothetical protein
MNMPGARHAPYHVHAFPDLLAPEPSSGDQIRDELKEDALTPLVENFCQGLLR